jgi:alpha-mannosidase
MNKLSRLIMNLNKRNIFKTFEKILIIAYINIFILIKGATAQPLMENSKEKNAEIKQDTVLQTMSYSHLDTQWRWDYKKTIREYILNTMKDNFKLFEKYPHYIFNFSGANRYKMMKEYYPKDYELVKKYIAAGKWFPCGSSMEENDALVPSPESIIRQVLYGNDYFRKEFGKDSYDYMLPDCFGFSAALPSILSHCGLKGFSTQKLTWGSAIGIPFNIGIWEGLDGESIVAVFNPGDYVTTVNEDLSKSQKWMDRIKDMGKSTGLYKEYMYVGTGDVGGAPAEESIKWIEESMKSDGPIKVLSTTADQLFKEITSEQKSRFPKYKGELLLTNHSAGSITSSAYMKRWNRKNELLAFSSEAFSVIGSWLGGIIYPQEKINEAWRLVMGGQFHDILPGTCIPKAYEYSWNDEILASNQFSNVLSDASGAIARAMDTRVKGIPVIVYNPLSFDREEVVKASVKFTGKAPEFVKVLDSKNNEVPSQIISTEKNLVTLLFLAKVPSVGCAVFDISPAEKEYKKETGLKITGSTLENKSFIVKLNSAGDIESIFDKKVKKEVLSEPIRLAFLEEHPDAYPAWNMDWNDRKNPPVGYVEGSAEIKIVENGPVRISLEVTRETRGSKFIQFIRLSANDGNKVEVNNKIDWFSKQVSLKATFPLNVSNPLATYNTGLGSIQRGNNDSAKFEVPSQQWFDLSDEKGEYGVSILEDCKFGSDKPADNVLRLTLLYTPGVRSDFRDQASQDFGKHEFLYAVYPHKGDWKDANSNLEGERLNQPLIPFQTIKHDGTLGKEFSFLKINNKEVTLCAVKKAENSDEIIIRFRETGGKAQNSVEVSFPSDILSAREVNGQEQYITEAQISGCRLKFNIGSFHPKTFAIKLSHLEKINLPVCKSVDLPFDVNIMSFDGIENVTGFDGMGKSYPAELIPEKINSEGIIFNTGEKAKDKHNALICNAQKIKLPEGKFNRIYFLAASLEDTKGEFKINNKAVEIPVSKWNGFIGSWDNRIWDGKSDTSKPDYYWGDIEFIGLKPGYIKNDNVAYFTTHTHLKNGENDPYQYAYMFKYMIEIEPGTNEIILPKNDKIRIFSMTAAYNENDNAIPAHSLKDVFARKEEEYRKYNSCKRPVIISDIYYIDQEKSLPVKIESTEPGAEIRYTMDGTDPNENSIKYIGTIELKGSAVIKAASFMKGKNPSKIVEANFYKAYLVKDIKYITQCNPKYIGKGDKTLIDSVRAGISLLDKNWLGYEGDNLEVVLDLGFERPLHKVTIGCLNNTGSWIFLPVGMNIECSKDGKNFIPAGSMTHDSSKPDDVLYIKDFSVNVNNIMCRYIKIAVKNLGKCPDWHPGKGGKCWIFADEIIVE